ncbi:Profilin-1B [Escovopsis weberi]|uniref:Profilin n=1 Tax=Escovopsis weberi TaxID=150374 RepID=A0A0M9VW91_ESCWE|nr:Profilin-1B [Escovopsis weberi]
MLASSLTTTFTFLTIVEDDRPTTPRRSSEYIDEHQAGLYSYPEGTCVASSGNVMAKPSNITFHTCFERPTSFFSTGVNFNGVNYMTLRANSRTVFAQKGASGIIACKTQKSVVVGVYNDQADPSVAFEAVENLAEFLRSRE